MKFFTFFSLMLVSSSLFAQELKIERSHLENQSSLLELKAEIARHQQAVEESKDQILKKMYKYRKVSLAAMVVEIDSHSKNKLDTNALYENLRSLSESYDLSFRSPVPTHIPASYVWTMLSEKMGTGEKPASNIRSMGDLSKQDPKDSSFWKNPGDVSGKNLFLSSSGTRVDLANKKCEYDEPKTSAGTRGGFEVKCDGLGYKLKFGPETNVEPLNTRLYSALGYPVPTVEFTPGVELKYDRKVFLEFQSRAEQQSTLTIAGISVYKIVFGVYHNPFKFMAGARLKNGNVISRFELYKGLFGKDLLASDEEADEMPKIELEKENYNKEFEKQIATLLTVHGNLEVKVKNQDSAGSWDYNNPVHIAKREVRGAGILAAWLGNIDVRYDNTKLFVSKQPDGTQTLVHSMSDIGYGLGSGIGFPKINEKTLVNKFPWTFTIGQETARFYSSGVRAKVNRYGFAINNYYPLDPNEAFFQMTLDDAKWMARKIMQLSEEQLKVAIIGAGFESAEAYMVFEKLLNRRGRMVSDLGLAAELGINPISRDNVPDYEPSRDGAFKGTLPDGSTVAAPIGKSIVRKGKITPKMD